MKSKKKAKPFTSGSDAWILFALDDLKAAQKLLEDGPWNLVCFHAQQGSEKAFKAYLRYRTNDVPRVHSLGRLVELCAKVDKTFIKLKNVALGLDRYYIPTRYPEAAPGALPDGLPEYPDARQALKDVTRILRFVRNKLKKPTKGPLGL